MNILMLIYFRLIILYLRKAGSETHIHTNRVMRFRLITTAIRQEFVEPVLWQRAVLTINTLMPAALPPISCIYLCLSGETNRRPFVLLMQMQQHPPCTAMGSQTSGHKEVEKT